MRKRICEKCGKTFFSPHLNRFCSRKCYGQTVTGKGSARWNSNEYVCRMCKKKYFRRESFKYVSRFCSNKCKNRWRSQFESGENSRYWTRETKKCIVCGKSFYVKKSKIHERFTCSRKCRAIVASVREIGEGNPAWKGGLSFIPYPANFNEILKEQIRNRDDRRCKLCGKTEQIEGMKLAVHHIDYNKDNCESWNLISLCRRCNLVVNLNREYWQNSFRRKFHGLLFGN